MITTLRLRNFKSFKDTGPIALKPITVLAGANSAGKSSILQSLLLLKQTLEAPPNIDLSLDGKYLQYSQFNDLVFRKPPLRQCNVMFQFGIELSMPSDVVPRYFPSVEVNADDVSDESKSLSTTIALTFRSRKKEDRNVVVLHAFDIQNTLDTHRGPRLSGSLTSGSDKYRVKRTGHGIELPEHYKGLKISSVSGRHFIPSHLIFDDDDGESRPFHIARLNPIFTRPLHALENDLERNLSYLGPLRERPKRAYLHSGNPATQIGESGEYAAQILWLERDTKVRYAATIDQEPEEIALIDAVNDAFRRLGLQHVVDVSSVRSIMYQILFGLTAPGLRRSVTMADVGFGVSQLLPILMLGLRASPQSLLLFEQPEIHLHPRLQANLADFFLALAADGKRIVIETHSDHFINRLRRRIAEDQSDSLRELVNILFVHAPEGDVGSAIEPLSVDRFGVIENWPPGFLPEAADEASAIFAAGLEKRRNA